MIPVAESFLRRRELLSGSDMALYVDCYRVVCVGGDTGARVCVYGVSKLRISGNGRLDCVAGILDRLTRGVGKNRHALGDGGGRAVTAPIRLV